MKTYKIHFIRHGLTEANLQSLYVGKQTDSPLCPQEVQQLLELDQQFTYPGVAKLYTSPMMRCVQTANVLYPDLKQKQVVEEIAEMDFGVFEGKNIDVLKNDADFARFVGGEVDFVIPGGESMIDFSKRCALGMEKIIEDMMTNNIASAAVVTHGGVIMGMMASFGLPKLTAKELLVKNGYGFSVNVIPRLWQTDRILEIVGVMPHGATMDDSVLSQFI